MATEQSKKRLALAILDFLQKSQTDGSVSPEDAEQLEIATNCIAEAFKVDTDDSAAKAEALGSQDLLSIYTVYEKLKGKSTASTEGTSSAAEARPASPKTPGVDADTKAEAEKLKGEGNVAMKKKDYNAAAEFYKQALDLVPLNPIYLSNRAAAYSGMGKHDLAKDDAELAVAADPKYSKAWSRLGLARFALGDAKGAMEAYKSGMDAEGGGSEVMRKGYETAKRKYEEEGGDVGAPDADRGMSGGGGMPDLSSLAGMFGGGGGAGGGGMPDLGAMFQNPRMMEMAQRAMQDPNIQQMMNNPQMREMASRFGGGGGAGGQGGGAPDFASLLNNPAIMNMAQQFMGGMGGQGGAGGAGRGGQGQ